MSGVCVHTLTVFGREPGEVGVCGSAVGWTRGAFVVVSGKTATREMCEV